MTMEACLALPKVKSAEELEQEKRDAKEAALAAELKAVYDGIIMAGNSLGFKFAFNSSWSCDVTLAPDVVISIPIERDRKKDGTEGRWSANRGPYYVIVDHYSKDQKKFMPGKNGLLKFDKIAVELQQRAIDKRRKELEANDQHARVVEARAICLRLSGSEWGGSFLTPTNYGPLPTVTFKINVNEENASKLLAYAKEIGAIKGADDNE